MDEKRTNNRTVKTGGRRVTKTTTEYDWTELDRKVREERARPQSERPKTKRISELEQQVRYRKQQKQKRLKMKRRRMLLLLILAILLVLALMFLTPIFNIRSVSVEGNRLVSAEQFQEKLSPLVGENLFRTGAGKIRRTLKEISYIDTVDVQKKMFPPSVKVTVTEYTPAGLIRADGKSLTVSSSLIVIEDGSELYPVPAVTGLGVESYKVGGEVKTDDNEKRDIVLTALSSLEAVELTDKVIEINVSDVADITMNYDNRLRVECGSYLDFEHKIRMLRETVNALDENARGTIDLSEPGKAVHDPE